MAWNRDLSLMARGVLPKIWSRRYGSPSRGEVDVGEEPADVGEVAAAAPARPHPPGRTPVLRPGRPAGQRPWPPGGRGRRGRGRAGGSGDGQEVGNGGGREHGTTPSGPGWESAAGRAVRHSRLRR